MKMLALALFLVSGVSAWARLVDPVDIGDLSEKDHQALYACIAGCAMGQALQVNCEKQCWKLYGAVDDGRAKVAELCPKKVGRPLINCLFKAGQQVDAKTQSAELHPGGAGSSH